MVGQIGSFGSLNLVQGIAARPAPPVADAPTLTAHSPPRAAPISASISASTVALAPAAMSVLFEAQERLSQKAPAFVRQHTVDKIDELIHRLNGPESAAGASFAIRQLQTARHALSLGLVDLQA